MADWYNGDWGHRFKITSDNTKVAAAIKGLTYDLSDAPAGFWSKVKSDGGDIRVTAANGTTELARSVVSIDTTAETGQVRIDTSGLSTSADTDIYIYYDNDSATEPAAGSTYGSNNAYDSNLVSYWALDELSGTSAADSVGSNTGTANNARVFTNNQGSSGKINTGANFASGSDQIDFGSRTLSGAITVSQWVHQLSSGGSYQATFSHDDNSNNRFVIVLDSNANRYNGYVRVAGTQVVFSVNYVSGNTPINTWRMVTQVFDPSTDRAYLYIDGQEVAESAATLTGSFSSTTNTYIGSLSGSSSYFNGYIDETAVWNRVLSANEDLTFYNNESDNSAFWTTGAEEIPAILSISGVCTLSGSPISGAVVRIINQDTGEYVEDTTTDGNGEYSINVTGGATEYHVVAEYESEGTKYRSKSRPFQLAKEQ